MSSEMLIREPPPTRMIFKAIDEQSSEEPPMEEWSSCQLEVNETNVKKALFQEGLYAPGSGEICTKYITVSDSSVLRHPYFNYPGVIDPGIEKALLQPEPPIIYPDDGQVLYLELCKEMGQCPVRMFHKGLLNDVIDLRYYGVNPNSVRCMGIAMKFNNFVKVLNLTDNFLNNDACYHLGEMLTTNSCLRELNLCGCRIGVEGLRRLLPGLIVNRSLKVLNLNKNQLGDTGIQLVARGIVRGMDVENLYLSYNDLSANAANILTEAFNRHNKLVLLDLSWNNLYSPAEVYVLLTKLAQNEFLQTLDLSWNSLAGARIGNAIKILMKAPNLQNLNLSNNRLTGDAISNLLKNIEKPQNLVLNLSYNPMTPTDALSILNKLKLPEVKLNTLLLDNVLVGCEFLEALKEIRELEFRRDTVITHGGLTNGNKPTGPDPRDVVLNRADFLCLNPKKQPIDIALVLLKLLKTGNKIMSIKDFAKTLRRSGVPLDPDLIEEMTDAFAGPRTTKAKVIDLKLVADYIKRKWPERKLPITPPPEPIRKKSKRKAKKKH